MGPQREGGYGTAFGPACGKSGLLRHEHVGLKRGRRPLYTMAYTGVTPGMVIGVADDRGCTLQNEQDSRHTPSPPRAMLEPSDSAEALEFASWL